MGTFKDYSFHVQIQDSVCYRCLINICVVQHALPFTALSRLILSLLEMGGEDLPVSPSERGEPRDSC